MCSGKHTERQMKNVDKRKSLGTPLSFRLDQQQLEGVTQAAESLGLHRQQLARLAISAVTEAILKNKGRLVLPVQFVPVYVATKRKAD